MRQIKHTLFFMQYIRSLRRVGAQSLAKLDQGEGELPLIEVKGAGEHGLLYVTPSMHKNGFNYEIIGSTEPEVIDELRTILGKY